MDNFFQVKNVDFCVGGKTKVKNVSFSIENEGDIICLLGPSGIGKTTILRTIAGLEKINKGVIKLKSKTLSSEKTNVEPENRNISLAFQENSLFPHYTVKKNISLGAERNKGRKNQKVRYGDNGAMKNGTIVIKWEKNKKKTKKTNFKVRYGKNGL